MNINIRHATSDHAETIARFNQQMASETEDKPLDWDIIHTGVKTMLAKPDLGYYLVAEADGEICGCLGVTYEWSDWRNGLWWWVQSVYVRPESRSTGVFSAMYADVKTRAQQVPEVCGIRLYVEKDNDRAYQTYLRLGMIETGYRLMEEEF